MVAGQNLGKGTSTSPRRGPLAAERHAVEVAPANPTEDEPQGTRSANTSAVASYHPSVTDKNRLYFGDNLDILREHIADESVDLIYLDPPFNSNRNYSLIFSRNGQVDDENQAQIEAFEDTWHWTPTTEQQYDEFMVTGPGNTTDALAAFRLLLGENDAMAYLVNMAPRLVELHRTLKPTGSIYLHCDPTMSHYLKVLMDAIFSVKNFVNEIAWHYNTGGASKRMFSRKHDVILFYGKTSAANQRMFNVQREPFRNEKTDHFNQTDQEGRKYRVRTINNKDYTYYLDEGRICHDVWEIDALNAAAKERLGYPTQKPLSLLNRIVEASSNPGDVVLDPFCGCGTTVDAAQRLDRQWIGIDITYVAVDLITKRLRHTYGDSIRQTFTVDGIPSDVASARALFDKSPFDFERWAVSLIGAEPNQKQVGDKGIDGTARFPLGGGKGQLGRVLVSVKGGKTLNPAMVRDLSGTVETQKAAMGVLITLEHATRGVRDAINHGGNYTHPANGETFPRIQHRTITQLLEGDLPQMPPTVLPYIPAEQLDTAATAQEGLF